MKNMIGVDLGGTNVRVVVGDGLGRIVARVCEQTDKSSGQLGISRQIKRMINSLVSMKEIYCIGIGSAGPLDLRDGSIVNSPHMSFDRIPLMKPLKRAFKVPVYMANDCVAAVIAEKKFGQGKNYRNLVYVTLSSGIGAGVYVDNHLLIGKDGNAHEVGHMIIDQTEKLLCGCGKKGHWEAYCGGDNIARFVEYQLESRPHRQVQESLLRNAMKGHMSRVSPKGLFDLARSGDRLALDIVREVGRLNAIGFANIVEAYDPELITVGGAIALANSKLVIEPIKQMIRRYCLNKIPKIRITQLGEDIVLKGALALKDLVEQRPATPS
jgi:glucokinase